MDSNDEEFDTKPLSVETISSKEDVEVSSKSATSGPHPPSTDETVEHIPYPAVTVVRDIVEAPETSASSSGPDSILAPASDTGSIETLKVKRSQREKIPFSEDSSFDGLTRRQLLNLAVLALADFVSAMVLTNQNPWFPMQAKEHGISSGLTGVVFGAFELACFVFLPLFQGKLHQSGVEPQTLFLLGIFTTSSSVILFSFLGYATDSSIFLGFAILLRFVEGIGQAALITASFAIIALEFPTASSSAFVSIETFFGLGLIVGPPLGGALWDAILGPKRFTLTFGVLGVAGFIVAVFSVLVLPHGLGDHVRELERNGHTRGLRVFGLLKAPSIPLMAFVLFSMAVSVGFLYVTLSPHLAEFGLHPVLLGGIFLLNGGVAALFAPVFSKIVTMTRRSRLITIFGSVLIFVGFCLIGPVSFIPLQKTPWLVSVGLLIQGLGIAALCASTFRFMLYQAVKCGYADNIKTYWLVSSLWTMVFCSGTLVGTISSGFLVDGLGFPAGAWLVLDLQILVILFMFASILSIGIMKFQTSPRRSVYAALDTESEPLLGHPQGRSNFSPFHQKSEPRKRIQSDPSITQPSSSHKSYGGTEES